MADDTIRGAVSSLRELFDWVTYAIEIYQREYDWTAEHVRTLLTDLFEEFDSAESGRGSRRRWERPRPYFMGPFVYAEDSDRRFLVDGQQRFTTLHLIFLHLFRMSPDTSSSRARYQLYRAIVADERGTHPRFRLDVEERQTAIEALFHDRPYRVPFDASLSLQNLWDHSLLIEEMLADRLDTERYDRFVEWLLDSVVMVGVEALDRDHGFRIFESMNDRGARLTPADLVKSFLLSDADADAAQLNERWRDMLAELTRVRGDAGAPLEYLKSVLLAHHAELAGGSTDARDIDLAPHDWIRRNSARIGVRDGDGSSSRFVDDLLRLGRHYADLAAATAEPDGDLAGLYYNHRNGLTAQMALVMAAVRPGDTSAEARGKARLAANFVDLLYVVRAVHDEPVHPEAVNEEILRFVPLARACSTAEELAAILGREAPDVDFDVVRTFGLRGDNRGPVRYVLARLTAYVEEQTDRPVEIAEYLSSDRWQIEHLFADHPDQHPNLDPLRFRLARNRLGGLGLLPRRDSARIRELPFTEKVQRYGRCNTLLAVLSPNGAQVHPELDRLRTSHGLNGTLRAFRESTRMQKVIDVRGELYRELCRRIWDPAALGLVVPEPGHAAAEPVAQADPPHEQAPQVHPKPDARPPRTPLAGLVASGRITPGTPVHAMHDDTRREAVVDEQGRLSVSGLGSFRSPDEAGTMVTGRKRCTGWTFWHVTLRDGTAVTLREFRDNPGLRVQPMGSGIRSTV